MEQQKHYNSRCSCVKEFWKTRNSTPLHWMHRDNQGMQDTWLDILQNCCDNSEELPIYRMMIKKRTEVLATTRGINDTDTEVMQFDMAEFIEVNRGKGEKSLTAKKLINEHEKD